MDEDDKYKIINVILTFITSLLTSFVSFVLTALFSSMKSTRSIFLFSFFMLISSAGFSYLYLTYFRSLRKAIEKNETVRKKVEESNKQVKFAF